MQEFGKIIRDRRVQLKVNQQTLADLAGVGINTLVSIERGTGNPSVLVLQRVLDALGLQLRISLKE